MITKDIDPQVIDLYDDYCHGHMSRREFFHRAARITVGGVTALAMANAMLPDYVAAQTISFTDERIRPRYISYPSPHGSASEIRGYLVAPVGEGPFPAVLVIHENRGLNPHIEDVARRFATEGFVVLAPDALTAAGGYPGNDDDGRTLQRTLDRSELLSDMVNGARYLQSHELSTGALGVTGFCWGGSATNHVAATLGASVKAAVPFYGSGVSAQMVAGIKAQLLIQAAENDPRINKAWPEFEAALKTHEVAYERHIYPGTNHGFHNNSTPRYDETAAKLAWTRTVEFFKRQLDTA